MTLSIQSYGDPKNDTIVFLHGLGVSSWMWTPQVEALKADFHCITIDLPGNGESYQTPWVSIEDTASQVARIIRERTSTGKAHVVGLSLGGYLALAILRDHPQVVKSVVVSGVSARPLANPLLMKAMIRILGPLNRYDFMVNLNSKLMNLPDDAREMMRRDNKRLANDTLVHIYDEILQHKLPSELAQRSQPLLAVAGGEEVKAILSTLADYPALMPNARAYRAPKAHHGWNGEYPELFTDMVRAWVSGDTLPATLQVVGAT
jgi:pimeloyl-ACP methyl ester carboxylesterase